MRFVATRRNELRVQGRTPTQCSRGIPERFDELDRDILHLLQGGSRTDTAPEVATAPDVTANTVRNRIDRLEPLDVIRGYHPQSDHFSPDVFAGRPTTGVVVSTT